MLVGLRPGVVSALVEAGADVDGLWTAVDLDSGFALLQPEPETELDPGRESEAEADPASDPEEELPLESEQGSGYER